MSTPSAYGSLTFSGDAAVATLAASLRDGASAAVTRWLSSASAPCAVSDELAAQIAEVGGALSIATEAVLVDRFDAARGAHRAYSVLHDGRTAVIAGGGPEKGIVSAPQGLEEVVAQLSTEIGGRIDEAPARTARIGSPALLALRTALSPHLDRDRDSVEARLAELIASLEVEADPEAVLAALEADELLSRDGDLVAAGPALLRESALAAAVDGSTLTITRMSLSRSGEPLVYDVRALEFVGPQESRCLMLAPDEAGEIGFARLHVAETPTLLASHMVGRAEPARTASPPAEPEPSLPPAGTAAELSGAELLAAAGDPQGGRHFPPHGGEMTTTPGTAATAAALLAPPATVTLRRVEDGGDAAEGIAVWDAGVVGWSWRLGAGHALVEPREALARLTTAMLAERLGGDAPEELVLGVSTWTDRGLEYAAATIAPDEGRFVVRRTEGIDLPAEIGAEPLAASLLGAAGLAR